MLHRCHFPGRRDRPLQRHERQHRGGTGHTHRRDVEDPVGIRPRPGPEPDRDCGPCARRQVFKLAFLTPRACPASTLGSVRCSCCVDCGTPRAPHRTRSVLTEPGKTLLAYARRAILELDRARAELGTAEGIGGMVTVGLLPSTCDLLASPLVTAVATHYPRIRTRIAMGYAGRSTLVERDGGSQCCNGTDTDHSGQRNRRSVGVDAVGAASCTAQAPGHPCGRGDGVDRHHCANPSAVERRRPRRR